MREYMKHVFPTGIWGFDIVWHSEWPPYAGLLTIRVIGFIQLEPAPQLIY